MAEPPQRLDTCAHPALPLASPSLLPRPQMIYQVTVERARLEIPRDPRRCPPALQALIASCWDELPRNRPCAEEVQEHLQALQAQLGA